jgi:cytoskeletal protein RodZ
MGNPIDTLNVAAGAEALPLELLQPLDSSNPASTPVRLTGPEQRLNVTPDPGVGDASLLPPSQLLIGKDGATRSIWPVHLAGWQALGWQLLSPANSGDDVTPVNAGDNAPEPAVDSSQETPEQEPAPAPDEPTPTGEPLESTETTTSAGEALLASQRTDFQAMTKAQIVEFCSTVYGVELDGSQTKAELVEQATALDAQASASGTASGSNEGINDAADLAALELGDALL